MHFNILVTPAPHIHDVSIPDAFLGDLEGVETLGCVGPTLFVG